LREAESAISSANRRLRELGESRAETQAELAELESQQQRLTQQTTAQQAQLARLLRRGG
jgi:prefoldin subunit 5